MILNMPVKRYRRDQSEVSCCLKYIIFGFNIIFWFLGLGLLIIGIWAWTEKDTFNNLSKLTNIALDPAFALIVTAFQNINKGHKYWLAFMFIVCLITFTIGFTGCVGALRENTCLLACYAISLAILLLIQMTGGILGFIFKDWIKDQATNGFQTFIVHYRDDPDQQNLIDWIQEKWLECCGINGPDDWDSNVYFNCSSESVGSREACGVPFSCCKPKRNHGDRSLVIYDRGCLRAGEEWIETNLVPVAGVAVGLAILQKHEASSIIYDKGCLMAGEKWLEDNLLLVAGIAVLVAFLQILGICFAQNLRADIYAQKAKWN